MRQWNRLHSGWGERTRESALTRQSKTVAALPSRFAFRFDTSLDSPDFHWLQFGKQSYVPFKIPAIGQSVTLAGPRQ